MDNLLVCKQGAFALQRLPYRARELLRAWDAADEYVLDYLAQHGSAPECRMIIVNDSFGALALALHVFQPCAVSDSYLSHQATRLNLAANQLNPDAVQFKTSLDALSGYFDIVIIKIPKTLALLEYQLIRLRPHLKADSLIIAAGMVKNTPSSVWPLMERVIGPTTTSLAQKKARLIFARLNPDLPASNNPYPTRYRLESSNLQLLNHANVFSRDSLDIGTRFFLQHIPVRPEATDIIDLACGNGVVGIVAAQLNPNAIIHFTDESFMAVESARENFQTAFAQTRTACFYTDDGLTEFPPASADLILCNPPFHQQNTVGDHIATSLFKQARKALKPGGELRVIGNRHLGYHTALKKMFGQCVLQASNAKFVVLSARKA